MQKIPSLEELKELLNEARYYTNAEYIEKYYGWNKFLSAVEKAYKNLAKNLNEFWEKLADATFSVMISDKMVSDCKEAIEILTLNGKDCELENFRRTVDEAGLVSGFEIEDIDLIYLAKLFLGSAYSLEINELFEEAKNFWVEMQKLS